MVALRSVLRPLPLPCPPRMGLTPGWDVLAAATVESTSDLPARFVAMVGFGSLIVMTARLPPRFPATRWLQRGTACWPRSPRDVAAMSWSRSRVCRPSWTALSTSSRLRLTTVARTRVRSSLSTPTLIRLFLLAVLLFLVTLLLGLRRSHVLRVLLRLHQVLDHALLRVLRPLAVAAVRLLHWH